MKDYMPLNKREKEAIVLKYIEKYNGLYSSEEVNNICSAFFNMMEVVRQDKTEDLEKYFKTETRILKIKLERNILTQELKKLEMDRGEWLDHELRNLKHRGALKDYLRTVPDYNLTPLKGFSSVSREVHDVLLERTKRGDKVETTVYNDDNLAETNYGISDLNSREDFALKYGERSMISK